MLQSNAYMVCQAHEDRARRSSSAVYLKPSIWPCVAGVTPMEYLLLIAAAKKVSRVCCSNNFEAAATLASIPAPLLLLTWLQQQPASIVTKDCQHAAQKGAMALTHHLLHRSVCKVVIFFPWSANDFSG